MTCCANCGRTLKNEPVMLGGLAYGPKCAAAVRARLFPGKPAHPAKPAVHVEDERQPDLFPGSWLSRAAAWIAAIFNDATEVVR